MGREFEMQLVDKVLAYITRDSGDRLQLLVFDHRHVPDAGAQVPGGTVEPDEPIEDALWREIEEESGLRRRELRLVEKLAVYESESHSTRRHVFHLVAETPIADFWTQTVGGSGEDEGFVFDYRWVDLEDSTRLAGDQHAWLDLIGRS